jgi:hypothetical protein
VEQRNHRVKVVVMEYVKMHQVVNLAQQVVTRRLFQHKVSKVSVKGWMSSIWVWLLGNIPISIYCPKTDWFLTSRKGKLKKY